MNKFFKELSGWRYWAHIVLIAVGVLGTLQFFTGGEMFTLKNVLISIPLIAVWDIIAHKLTGLE